MKSRREAFWVRWKWLQNEQPLTEEIYFIIFSLYAETPSVAKVPKRLANNVIPFRDTKWIGNKRIKARKTLLPI